MSTPITINTALCLPAPDAEALIRGNIITVLSQTFISPGKQFAIYPSDGSGNLLPSQKHYQSRFLLFVESAFSSLNPDLVATRNWARCELCQVLTDPQALQAISKLTIWSLDALSEIVLQRGQVFLAYLRVYLLSNPIEISPSTSGQFIGLSPIYTDESNPVLSDRTFAQRRHQLENLLPPQHPELEELQTEIFLSSELSSSDKLLLDNDLKLYLGWSQSNPAVQTDTDLDWIKRIAEVGNSSDGNEFERLVRKGFIKLGFSNSGNNENLRDSLNPEKVGGAGGLDFYCDTPYSLVGECKATKTDKVPDGTAAQLVKLGYKHLQRQYNRCIKIIMAAGELTEDAELTASGNEMNVIRPETLQRLVELKAKYPGSIDLLALKPCLAEEPFGEAADGKLNRYIDTAWSNIKLRSHLIQLVKKANREVGIEYLSGSFDSSNSPSPIFNLQDMHEILVELSSTLTGYLGREKGSDWRSDRFYFLRDLPCDAFS
jgi:hypothetical protein